MLLRKVMVGSSHGKKRFLRKATTSYAYHFSQVSYGVDWNKNLI